MFALLALLIVLSRILVLIGGAKGSGGPALLGFCFVTVAILASVAALIGWVRKETGK